MRSKLSQAEQDPEVLAAGRSEHARDEHVALKEQLALLVGHEGDRCRPADLVGPAASIVPDSEAVATEGPSRDNVADITISSWPANA